MTTVYKNVLDELFQDPKVESVTFDKLLEEVKKLKPEAGITDKAIQNNIKATGAYHYAGKDVLRGPR